MRADVQVKIDHKQPAGSLLLLQLLLVYHTALLQVPVLHLWGAWPLLLLLPLLLLPLLLPLLLLFV